MNAIDKFAPLLALTRAPFPASTKSAIVGSRADLCVPVRDVALLENLRATLTAVLDQPVAAAAS